MDKMSPVYVLIHDTVGNLEMVTTNDTDAWEHYRDFTHMKLQIWVNGNFVTGIDSIDYERRSKS